MRTKMKIQDREITWSVKSKKDQYQNIIIAVKCTKFQAIEAITNFCSENNHFVDVYDFDSRKKLTDVGYLCSWTCFTKEDVKSKKKICHRHEKFAWVPKEYIDIDFDDIENVEVEESEDDCVR